MNCPQCTSQRIHQSRRRGIIGRILAMLCSSDRFAANGAIRDSSVGHSPQIPIRPGRQRCIDPSRAFSMHIFRANWCCPSPSYKHLFLVLRLTLFYLDRDRRLLICRSSFFVFAGGGAGDSPVGALSWCDEMQIARRVCFLVLNKAEGSWAECRKDMSNQLTDKNSVVEQTRASVPEMAPLSVSPSDRLLRRIATLLFLLVAGMLTLFGYYASSICITVVLAGFLAILFDPVVVKLEKLHLPRGVAAAYKERRGCRGFRGCSDSSCPDDCGYPWRNTNQR